MDRLPEHWVFSTNGSTPAAPMAVNVNASEAVPDFDVIMSTPALATFVAVGSPGADVIDGSGAGQSRPHQRVLTILGNGGADVLTGGNRDDTIDGGTRDDAIDGGPGFDVADYASSVLPVSIDLSAAGPQDGGSLGRDTLTSIEYLAGGEAGDLLRGTAAAETLDGGLGDDVLEGRGGDDRLFGDVGSDTASCASATGPVTLDLALATPQATGAAGTDSLEQVENVVGGPDTVLARDGGPDTVNCGPGTDRAEVDPRRHRRRHRVRVRRGRRRGEPRRGSGGRARRAGGPPGVRDPEGPEEPEARPRRRHAAAGLPGALPAPRAPPPRPGSVSAPGRGSGRSPLRP